VESENLLYFAFKLSKMKTINLNTGQHVKAFLFPDGQPHVVVENIEEGDEVRVICSMTSSDKLLQLLETANALENRFAKKKILVIPYLMGARYDRLMQAGDSIDLKVVAQLINSLQFEKVFLLDVHSDVATVLINNAINITNQELVAAYAQENAVLICPDAGAAKKVGNYFNWNDRLKEIVYCSKNRDLATGKLSLEVLEPQACENRNCVIIDDICDGGATFLAVAAQIKPKHLTLIVTHGLFSKGFQDLEKTFDEILTSDSCCRQYDSNRLKLINIDYENF
jgi:ribose-phosphate pyrophosphokinase